MLKFGKWINNFYWWDIIKIIISVGKEKVQFTLIFYLKQSKEVQHDLQRFWDLHIFSPLLLILLPGKMIEEKLTLIFAIWNMHAGLLQSLSVHSGGISR